MKRRELIGILAGAAAGWPLGASSQQLSMPVVGFLSSLGAADAPRIMPPFRRGLAETGYAEGHNVAFEYRWAEGEFTRLPAMVADLVSRRASVIAAVSGTPAALAAKAATATIPIVFAIGAGPVEVGLVASLSRPGGNITGATFYTALLGAKRLELLRELVPKATTVAVFANAKNPASVVDRTEVETAAPKLGLELRVFAVADEFTDLNHVVDGDDPFKHVRRLRNEKHADIVGMIVDDPTGCGLSTRIAPDSEEAYFVVHYACAAIAMSIAHKIGHILGARHVGGWRAS
jgi:ABC-type uncharacterized transport system substrate-binding protein